MKITNPFIFCSFNQLLRLSWLDVIKCFVRIYFQFSLPWNQESFIGYIGEILVDILLCCTFISVGGQFFLIFIALCVHFFTFNEMFASFVNELDRSTEDTKKTALIRKLIEFHVDIKGYESKISAISLTGQLIVPLSFIFQTFPQIQRRI